jgi:hypothetical protein
VSRNLIDELHYEERDDNASKKKICPIYKMRCSKFSFSNQLMEAEIGGLLLKHNRAMGYQVRLRKPAKSPHY